MFLSLSPHCLAVHSNPPAYLPPITVKDWVYKKDFSKACFFSYRSFLSFHGIDDTRKKIEAKRILNTLTEQGYALQRMEGNHMHKLQNAQKTLWIVSTPVFIPHESKEYLCSIGIIQTIFRRFCVEIEKILCPKHIFEKEEDALNFLEKTYIDYSLREAYKQACTLDDILVGKGELLPLTSYSYTSYQRDDFTQNYFPVSYQDDEMLIQGLLVPKEKQSRVFSTPQHKLKDLALNWKTKLDNNLKHYLVYLQNPTVLQMLGMGPLQNDGTDYHRFKFLHMIDRIVASFEQDQPVDLLALTDTVDSEVQVHLGTLLPARRDYATFYSICKYLWNEVYKVVFDAKRALENTKIFDKQFRFEVRAFIPEPSCLNPKVSHLWQFILEMDRETGKIYWHIKSNNEDKPARPTYLLHV